MAKASRDTPATSETLRSRTLTQLAETDLTTIQDLSKEIDRLKALLGEKEEQLELKEAELDEERRQRGFERTLHRAKEEQHWADKARDKTEFERRLADVNKDTDRKIEKHHLTGIYKKEDFKEVLHARYGEENPELVVLFFDFNKFKLVNDTYGHDVGDRILAAMGAALNEIDGLAVHWGGDEFVLIVEKTRALKIFEGKNVKGQEKRQSETDIDALKERIKRLFVEKIKEIKVEIDKDDPVLGGRFFEEMVSIPLSVSTGMHIAKSADYEHVMESIRKADLDLEHSKSLLRLEEARVLLEKQNGMAELRSLAEQSVVASNVPVARELNNTITRLGLRECGDLAARIIELIEKDREALENLSILLETNGYMDAVRFLDGPLVGSPQIQQKDLIPARVITGRE